MLGEGKGREGRKVRADMSAAPIPREWVGLHQFPAATQTKLHELLGKLKEEVLHAYANASFMDWLMDWR